MPQHIGFSDIAPVVAVVGGLIVLLALLWVGFLERRPWLLEEEADDGDLPPDRFTI